MTINIPSTYVANQIITALHLNTYLKDNLEYISSRIDYKLVKASGVTIPFAGGTMSTAEKQAASWTFTTGGSFTDTGNSYDGDTATYDTLTDLEDGLTAEIDFGSDVILDEIDVFLSTSLNVNFTVKYSDTGAFSGEETTLSVTHTKTNPSGSIYKNALTFSTAQARYWQIYFQYNNANPVNVLEYDFVNATTLAIQGVPWGCEVELFDDTTSKETQISQSILRPGIVEFTTADIADVDKVTITKPDGSTAWLEFTSLSFSSGDIYTLYNGQ